MTRRNKIACIALLVVFAILLSGLGVHHLLEAEADRQFREEVKRVAAPYELKKTGYTMELYNLERELQKLLPCGATMTMVVTSVDEMLYTDVYPIFSGVSKYNVKGETISLVGTICFRKGDLPGDEGNITLEQYNELVLAGWDTALYIDHKDASNLPGYLAEMKAELAALDIPMPNNAYFISGAYSVNHDDALMSHGIRNVIHHEEGGLNLIGTDTESAMWRVGDIGWNTSGVANSTFTSLVTGSGNLVFSLGFEEWDKNRRFVGDDMGNASFARMLDKFRDCVRSGELYVDTLSAGYRIYKEHHDQYLELAPALEPRRRELQAEVDRVNAILFRIYEGDFSVAEENGDA